LWGADSHEDCVAAKPPQDLTCVSPAFKGALTQSCYREIRNMVESWAMTSEDESSGEAGSNVNVAVEEPRLLHALPGRVRVHLAGWPRERQCAVAARLRQVPRVHSVQANRLTGNVTIHFDTTATDEYTILAEVRTPTLD